MARSYNKRTADLSDDDAQAIREITGQLYDGHAVEARIKWGVAPPRNCPPWMKRDPEMTARFLQAVNRHEPSVQRIEDMNAALLERINKMIADGEIEGFKDIPEDVLAQVALSQLTDSRRPSVVAKQIELIATIKGLKRGEGTGGTSQELEALLDNLLARRSSQVRGPRPMLDEESA